MRTWECVVFFSQVWHPSSIGWTRLLILVGISRRKKKMKNKNWHRIRIHVSDGSGCCDITHMHMLFIESLVFLFGFGTTGNSFDRIKHLNLTIFIRKYFLYFRDKTADSSLAFTTRWFDVSKYDSVFRHIHTSTIRSIFTATIFGVSRCIEWWNSKTDKSKWTIYHWWRKHYLRFSQSH